MARVKKKTTVSMEEALLRFLSQLDTQVAREMQRSPEEREKEGVQKWEPYEKREERIITLLVEEIGKNTIGFDEVFLSTRAFVRMLRILVEEFGAKGLGHVRSEYVREIFKGIERDISLVKESLEENASESVH